MRTRAQELGVKPKILERRALKMIARMEKLALEIAGLYGDIDQGVCNDIDSFRSEHLADLCASITHTTEYLGEEAGT